MLLEYVHHAGMKDYRYVLGKKSTVTLHDLQNHDIPNTLHAIATLSFAEYLQSPGWESLYMRKGKITPEDIKANAEFFQNHYNYLIGNKRIPLDFLLQHFGKISVGAMNEQRADDATIDTTIDTATVTATNEIAKVESRPFANCIFNLYEITRMLNSPYRVEYQAAIVHHLKTKQNIRRDILGYDYIIGMLDSWVILDNLDLGWNIYYISKSRRISIWEKLARPEVAWQWDHVHMAVVTLTAPNAMAQLYEKMCEDGTITGADIDSAPPEVTWNLARLAEVPSLSAVYLVGRIKDSEIIGGSTLNVTTFGLSVLSMRQDLPVDTILEDKYLFSMPWNWCAIFDNIYNQIMNAA